MYDYVPEVKNSSSSARARDKNKKPYLPSASGSGPYEHISQLVAFETDYIMQENRPGRNKGNSTGKFTERLRLQSRQGDDIVKAGTVIATFDKHSKLVEAKLVTAVGHVFKRSAFPCDDVSMYECKSYMTVMTLAVLNGADYPTSFASTSYGAGAGAAGDLSNPLRGCTAESFCLPALDPRFVAQASHDLDKVYLTYTSEYRQLSTPLTAVKLGTVADLQVRPSQIPEMVFRLHHPRGHPASASSSTSTSSSSSSLSLTAFVSSLSTLPSSSSSLSSSSSPSSSSSSSTNALQSLLWPAAPLAPALPFLIPVKWRPTYVVPRSLISVAVKQANTKKSQRIASQSEAQQARRQEIIAGVVAPVTGNKPRSTIGDLRDRRALLLPEFLRSDCFLVLDGKVLEDFLAFSSKFSSSLTKTVLNKMADAFCKSHSPSATTSAAQNDGDSSAASVDDDEKQEAVDDGASSSSSASASISSSSSSLPAAGRAKKRGRPSKVVTATAATSMFASSPAASSTLTPFSSSPSSSSSSSSSQSAKSSDAAAGKALASAKPRGGGKRKADELKQPTGASIATAATAASVCASPFASAFTLPSAPTPGFISTFGLSLPVPIQQDEADRAASRRRLAHTQPATSTIAPPALSNHSPSAPLLSSFAAAPLAFAGSPSTNPPPQGAGGLGQSLFDSSLSSLPFPSSLSSSSLSSTLPNLSASAIPLLIRSFAAPKPRRL
jgi:hypothetical protein